MKQNWMGMARMLLAVFLLAASLCAGTALAQDGLAVIDTGKLHLRAAPSVGSESYGLFFSGTQVTVTGASQGDFLPVRVGALDGFMHADYLAAGNAARNVIPAQPTGVATPKVGARLRSGPSTDTDSLTVIDQGEVFTVLGETKSHWYYVDYGGQTGYVSAEVANLVDEVDGRPMAFGPVLLGEDAFVWPGGGKTVDELKDCFETEAVTVPTSFAVLDMDGDALKEVVVRAALGDEDFGFLVLDLQTELVYGYTFYRRAMQDLKQDGTFCYSSGAMDNGIGRVKFRGPVVEKTELARSRDGAAGKIDYTVNGQAASQATFEEAVRMQAEKPDVVWIPFTKANIEARFAP